MLNDYSNEQSLGWHLIVASLATWRLTHLLMYEDGPNDILVRMRELLGVEYEHGLPVHYRGIGTVFSCFWCLSIYVSFMLLCYRMVTPTLALSAIAIFIEERLMRSSGGISSD